MNVPKAQPTCFKFSTQVSFQVPPTGTHFLNSMQQVTPVFKHLDVWNKDFQNCRCKYVYILLRLLAFCKQRNQIHPTMLSAFQSNWIFCETMTHCASLIKFSNFELWKDPWSMLNSSRFHKLMNNVLFQISHVHASNTRLWLLIF